MKFLILTLATLTSVCAVANTLNISGTGSKNFVGKSLPATSYTLTNSDDLLVLVCLKDLRNEISTMGPSGKIPFMIKLKTYEECLELRENLAVSIESAGSTILMNYDAGNPRNSSEARIESLMFFDKNGARQVIMTSTSTK